ncbi:PepSY domain-containing protein [Streptomyces sp. NPDC091272]|uniref:PepSY domain-containing protein n=1 Tax=Streptomyces sp. NPDC091272 TaxID=3365981 RepID=UPI00382F65E5
MIEREHQKRNQQAPSRPAPARAVLAACGVATAMLFVGACGSSSSQTTGSGTGEAAASASPAAVASSASPSPSTSRLTDDQSERQRLLPMAKVGYEKAGTTAQEKVSGGKLVAMELTKKTREGAPVWETDVAQTDGTVQRVDVDAIGGKVAEPRADDDQDKEDKQKLVDRLSKAKVTWDKAAKTATDRKKGTVTTVELDDMDDKRLVWKVDVVTPGNWDKTTYDIDAADGSVVREHVDRD